MKIESYKVIINCASFNKDGVITNLGGISEINRMPFKFNDMSKDKLINLIKGIEKNNNIKASIVTLKGTEVNIIDEDGSSYLRTKGNDSKKDNLGNISECPK